MNLKDIGYAAEQLVADHYTNSGYNILERNFTIRGGEIDIIATKDKEIIFIEVKAVHHTQDLHNYITPTKLSTLRRTIQHYLYTHPTDHPIRLDVAFVKGNAILHFYKNITNN